MDHSNVPDDEPQDLSKKSCTPPHRNSLLRSQLEARPTGLSLLVAALDAQNPESFRSNTAVVNCAESMDDTPKQRPPTSVSPTGSVDSTHNSGSRRRPIPVGEKDEAYWEKRRRNNEAAKRSREKRRINDMAMESRLLELSKQNNQLKTELETVKIVTHPNESDHCSSPSQQIRPSVIKPEPQLIQSALAAGMPRLAVSLNQQPNMAKIPPLPISTANPVPSLPINAFSAFTQTVPTQPLLATMVPPANLLHLYQAQYQAAMAAQTRLTAVAAARPIPTGAFQPAIGGGAFVPENQQSPDSTEILPQAAKVPAQNDILANSLPFVDGKQYLRYKLLERQQRRSVDCPVANDLSSKAVGSPLLGSLLSNGRHSPPSMQPDSSELSTNGLSLKQCLSSLAVHLGEASSSGGSGKSESSHTSDSLVSPASSHHSNASNHSQASPPQNGSVLQTLQTSASYPRRHDQERYTERRKRNNEAAKRCRANRRSLFEYRFKRAQQLEQENRKLKEEMQRLGRELMELKQLLTNRKTLDGVSNCSELSEQSNDSPSQNQRDSGNESQTVEEGTTQDTPMDQSDL